MTSESPEPAPSDKSPISPWRLTAWICAAVIIGSVVACVALAAVRSEGLTQITVTALNADEEPRDHDVPLFKQKEALPDYQIIVSLQNGRRINLGAKPNTSAVEGLVWGLGDPVSVTDVASVRLQDQDKVVSDAITEVQITDPSVHAKNYRFDFQIERSYSVGVQSFFGTPIGQAITGAFFLAVLAVLGSAFAV